MKNLTKKVIIILFLLLFLLFIFQQKYALASFKKEACLYFFWAKGCPHCKKENLFLKELEKRYKNLKILKFEVTENKANYELLKKVVKKLNASFLAVPFTVVGKNYFIGWQGRESTGKKIEEAIKETFKKGCPDLLDNLLAKKNEISSQKPLPEKVKLPLFGEIKIKNISLPFLTILLGTLDGFNPCAMWVLIFLISLLFKMKNRKKMWILGSSFVAVSAFSYFLFMAAWLNILLFLGFVFWIRLLIGGVALFGGVLNLKSYLAKTKSCKIEKEEKKRKILEKIKNFIEKKGFFLALLGIVVLAFLVNLLELVCSAGFPALFTQILALNNLSFWQYYFYLFLYIVFFMADDLLVFFIAMKTLKFLTFSEKYKNLSNLIGGTLMVLLGILLILKPEVLMFG